MKWRQKSFILKEILYNLFFLATCNSVKVRLNLFLKSFYLTVTPKKGTSSNSRNVNGLNNINYHNEINLSNAFSLFRIRVKYLIKLDIFKLILILDDMYFSNLINHEICWFFVLVSFDWPLVSLAKELNRVAAAAWNAVSYLCQLFPCKKTSSKNTF